MGKHIIITEARCSFPQLYSKSLNEGVSFNPGITIILEEKKHATEIAKIKAGMREAINSNPKLKKAPPEGDKLCLRKVNRDELAYKNGNLMLKAGNPKPPLVLFPDGRTPMDEGNNLIFSGCYVNAKIEIWGQSNNWGKRINAKIIAVQFCPKEADSFDGSYVSPEVAAEGFSSLEEDSTGGGFLEDENSDDLLG